MEREGSVGKCRGGGGRELGDGEGGEVQSMGLVQGDPRPQREGWRASRHLGTKDSSPPSHPSAEKKRENISCKS
jgi:hypothetical protein